MIKVGWDLKRISPSEIGKYAIAYLESHPAFSNQYITELITGVPEDEIDSCLIELFNVLGIQAPEKESAYWEKLSRVWRCAILVRMIQEYNDPQELLHAVEAVYADFGYPEDMSQFIYYMPCEYSAASSAQSPDDARLLLFEALKDFLAQEKLFLLSHVEKLK